MQPLRQRSRNRIGARVVGFPDAAQPNPERNRKRWKQNYGRYVHARPSPTEATATMARDMGLADRIPPESTCFHRKTRPPSVPPMPGGAASSPLLYPGNAPPLGTPALQLVKEGYTLCRGRETARFSAAAEKREFLHVPVSTFWPFGRRFRPDFGDSHRILRLAVSRSRFSGVHPFFTVFAVLAIRSTISPRFR